MKAVQQPWADAGVQSEGVGPPAVNWGETGDAGALHPLSPIASGQAVSPTEGVHFSGVMRLGMLDHVRSLIGGEINPVLSDCAVTSLKCY